MKIETKIVEVTMKELNKHLKRKEVYGYCKSCPNYNKIWTCPPYLNKEDEFISAYNYAYIIESKVIFEENEIKTEEEVLSKFQEHRRKLGNRLLEIEKTISDSVSLYAGNCYHCDNCLRENSIECKYPEKKRYSLESVGYDVSLITKNILDSEILWMQGQIPEYLLAVAAIFTKKEVNKIKLQI